VHSLIDCCRIIEDTIIYCQECSFKNQYRNSQWWTKILNSLSTACLIALLDQAHIILKINNAYARNLAPEYIIIDYLTNSFNNCLTSFGDSTLYFALEGFTLTLIE
jgi:hypothetical protein